MRYYRIIPEANGTFTIYVNEVGTLPGTYTGFKSEAEANSWVAEQQKIPTAVPKVRDMIRDPQAGGVSDKAFVIETSLPSRLWPIA